MKLLCHAGIYCFEVDRKARIETGDYMNAVLYCLGHHGAIIILRHPVLPRPGVASPA